MINDFEKMKIRYQEIQKAFLEIWNVATTDTALLLQYDSYISKIYQMLLSNEPKNEIFYYFWCLEEKFRLPGNAGKINGFIEKLFEIFSDQSLNIIKITVADVKQVFNDIIQKKITFEEASNWAFKINKLDETKQLEYNSKDFRKIFKGINFLMGVDLLSSPGTYQYSIDDVKYESDKYYGSESDDIFK